MKLDLLKYLKCLKCGASDFNVEIAKETEMEIRDGSLTCNVCGEAYKIKNGIVDVLNNPSDSVIQEIEGTERHVLKDGMPEAFSKENLLKMPYISQEGIYGHFEAVAANFTEMFNRMELYEDKVILDIGAAHCWTSNLFAKEGCKVIATDLIMTKQLGLDSADIYMENGVYFERVRSDMHEIPIKDSSIDYVVFNNVLHHSSHIDKVIKNCYDVLKTGGKLILIGESSYGLFSKKEEFGRVEREEYGINENTYPLLWYRKSMKKSGFQKIRFFFPPSIDYKLSTGNFGWKSINKNLFKLMHSIWRIKLFNMILKKLMFWPGVFLYNFQVHSIAEK